MKYIFMVAGKGTRLQPLTLSHPKSMYKLDENTTLLQRMVALIKKYDEEADIIDNSFIMLLKALVKAGVKQVNVAGFDGYSEDKLNFINPDMEYTFIKDRTAELNQYAKDKLAELSKDIEVNFVTTSLYTM